FFFFQAEDGIRDRTVTGVQTCALPISDPTSAGDAIRSASRARRCSRIASPADVGSALASALKKSARDDWGLRCCSAPGCFRISRSEERCVGKECRMLLLLDL